MLIDVEVIRELFESAFKQRNIDLTRDYFEQALIACNDVITNDKNIKTIEITKNLRRTYLRNLLRSLNRAIFTNASFEQRRDYMILLDVHAKQDVALILNENPELGHSYQQFATYRRHEYSEQWLKSMGIDL